MDYKSFMKKGIKSLSIYEAIELYNDVAGEDYSIGENNKAFFLENFNSKEDLINVILNSNYNCNNKYIMKKDNEVITGNYISDFVDIDNFVDMVCFAGETGLI